jgi:PAS domain S-box-containing protein
MNTDLLALRSAMAKLDRPWRAYQQESERLAAARQRYLDFFEFSPEAYLVTGSWCTVREANRAASWLLGSPARTLIGKPFAVLVHPDDRREFRDGVSALKSGAGWQASWTLRLGREGQEKRRMALGVRRMSSGLCWSLREAA